MSVDINNTSQHSVREYTSSNTDLLASDPTGSLANLYTPIIKISNLSFLRNENILSPAHNNYIPPAPKQILDIIHWAGLNGGGSGKQNIAQVANVEEFQMRRYTNTNKPIEEVPTIPGPVWRYLLIRLGVIEQPTIRRSEPKTTATNSFKIENRDLTLRAKIWYERDSVTVDIFDDSTISSSRKDGKPVFSFTLEHDVSQTTGNTIGGLLRHDEFYSQDCQPILASLVTAAKNRRLKEEEAPFYFTFLDKDVWPALRKLHDFHSISPRDFLSNSNLDPFNCTEDQMPTHREILALAGWAGIKRSDLAFIAGEKIERMGYLMSGRGESKFREAKTAFDKGQINAKNLAGIRWANQISRHSWALILSAFGLGPQIPVIGRSEPRARKVRTFELNSVQGVPTEFVKVETLFSFSDAALNTVCITGSYSTQTGKQPEFMHTFKVTVSLEGTIAVDGAKIGKNSEPPTTWANLVNEVPDVAKSYMEKALWHNLGNWLTFYHAQ
ncbi:hypothetical protein FPV63_12515 [Vibrio cholerae]|nr:hypothetical protein FPV63_12515 [Vibrio cholerae]